MKVYCELADEVIVYYVADLFTLVSDRVILPALKQQACCWEGATVPLQLMSDSLRKVISGKKLGDLLLPPAPMVTRSKRAAAAAAEPDSNIDFTGERPISGDFDTTSVSDVIVIT